MQAANVAHGPLCFTSRLFVVVILAFVLTNGDNALAALGYIPGSTNAIFISLLLGATWLCWCFVPQSLSYSATLILGSEMLLSFGLLYLPVIIGLFWYALTPSDLGAIGFDQIFNMVFACLTFMAVTAASFRTGVAWVARASMVLYLISIGLDILSNGVLFTLFSARGAGFMGNPNGGAAQLALLLVPCLRWNRAPASGYFWCLLGLTGIATTLSRSGLLAWVVIFAGYTLAVFLVGRTRAKAVTAATILATVLAIGAIVNLSPEQLSAVITNTATVDRIEAIAALAKGDTSALAEDPRAFDLITWKERIKDAPYFGEGASFSLGPYGPWLQSHNIEGPHDMYLARYADTGVLGEFGLIAFVLFWLALFMVYRYPGGMVFMAVFAEVLLFSHNAVDLRQHMSIFGLMAAGALYESRHLPSLAVANIQAYRDATVHSPSSLAGSAANASTL